MTRHALLLEAAGCVGPGANSSSRKGGKGGKGGNLRTVLTQEEEEFLRRAGIGSSMLAELPDWAIRFALRIVSGSTGHGTHSRH